tara:strand:- start:299 stop:484 length:186 start_codon:yes stop_codon:yes gene_type:complete
MQFTKNTSKRRLDYLGKLLIKIALIVFVIFLGVILVGKIDFPAPNKKIEKIISNDNFKTIK